MRLRVLPVLFAAMLTGAQAQFNSNAAPHALSANTFNIALLRQSWIEDLEAKRLFSSVGRYAPDATYINPDGTHAEGIIAIRALYNSLFEHLDAVMRMTSRVTSQSGEIAYDSGAWEEDLTDRATHISRHTQGDYLTIYRRQGMGTWLIVQQAFTEGPAAR